MKLNRRHLLGGGAALGAAGLGLAPAAPAFAAPIGTDLVTVRPEDPRYGDLITPFNQRWVGHPELVRLPTTTAQVVRAVQDAVSAGKRVTVRGGGHGYEDFIYNSEVQVVIDMNLMNTVSYDPGRRAFAVEAGATLSDVYNTLYQGWGVTVPGGVCANVGTGGHVSGGGYGMLSRKHGLVVDHLYGVEVVTVDRSGRARAVVATREARDANRELWWAHAGGGGGNFGVITRYFFRTPGASGHDPASLLPRPPKEVLVTTAAWSWDDVTEDGFARLLHAYGQWHETNQDPASPNAGLCCWLFLPHRCAGSISLLLQMDATPPDANNRVERFLALLDGAVGARNTHTTMRMPWLKATRHMGTSSELQNSPTFRGEHKSAYLRRAFPDRQIAAIWRHLNRADYANAFGMLVATSYGGRVNTVAPHETAVAQRSVILKLLYQTYWKDPTEDAANVAWLREFYRDVYADTGGVPVPNDVTDGCYINYPDSDISDPAWNVSAAPWHELYYKGNYARLQRVKAAWDPGNVFRHRQSIRLPGA
ncbi:FAD-binding oxidoreductase [Dactylosporangium sp. NPDC000555]|uniref:FAD-binding oxidoreductase n=1 Tax=Dactylosporangium sp. NPDC000555 TaxID=3154260 RepID=UPI003333EAEE